MMNSKQICGAIVALCVAAVAARADSLELKNGSLIKGKFMGGMQTSITFQVDRRCKAMMSPMSVRSDSIPKRRAPRPPSPRSSRVFLRP